MNSTRTNSGVEDIDDIDFGSGQPLHAADAARRLLESTDDIDGVNDQDDIDDNDDDDGPSFAFSTIPDTAEYTQVNQQQQSQAYSSAAAGSKSKSSSTLFERIRQQQQQKQQTIGAVTKAPGGNQEPPPPMMLPKELEIEKQPVPDPMPSPHEEQASPETFLPAGSEDAPAGHTPALSPPINTPPAEPIQPPLYSSQSPYPSSSSGGYNNIPMEWDFDSVMGTLHSGASSAVHHVRRLVASVSSRGMDGENVSPLLSGGGGMDQDEELGYGRRVTYSIGDYVVKFCKDLWALTFEKLDPNQRVVAGVGLFLLFIWIFHKAL